MRTIGAIGVIVLTTTLSAPATGQAFRTDAGHVSYTSKVTLHNFTGSSKHLVGRIDLADSTVDFYVDLETLKSGIGKRDRDMRISLETKKYPFGSFYGKLVSPFDLKVDSVQQAKVVGDFSIHGVSRHIEVSGTVEPTSEGLKVKAEWPIKLEDYKIEPPSLLMLTVDEVQLIHLEALLRPETKNESNISS